MKRKQMPMRGGKRPPGRDPGFGKVPPGVSRMLQGVKHPRNIDPGFAADPTQMQAFGRVTQGLPQQPVHVPGKAPGIIASVLAQAGALKNPQLAPQQPAPPSGPYQGAAGSEAQHPGQQRVPQADWANPSSPNYERRNYYQLPDGTIVAREPGYYNPDNPFDTGREGERNKELGTWDPSYERRMDEPGVTPWGPGGKASKPGTFPAPAGVATAAGQHPARNPLLASLLERGDVGQIPGLTGQESILDYAPSRDAADPMQALLLALSQQLARLPRRGTRNAA